MAFLALQADRAYSRIYCQRLEAEAKGRTHSRADAPNANVLACDADIDLLFAAVVMRAASILSPISVASRSPALDAPSP